METQGTKLREGLETVIADAGISEHVVILGRPSCLVFGTKDHEGKPSQAFRTLFIQEIAPRSDDAHQDHRLLGVMAPTVWRDAQVLHYEIPKWDGDMSRPNAYVAVAPELARRKVDALDRHYQSQLDRDWWDEEMFLGLMRVRGMECRTRYADAFHIGRTVLGFGQAAGAAATPGRGAEDMLGQWGDQPDAYALASR